MCGVCAGSEQLPHCHVGGCWHWLDAVCGHHPRHFAVQVEEGIQAGSVTVVCPTCRFRAASWAVSETLASRFFAYVPTTRHTVLLTSVGARSTAASCVGVVSSGNHLLLLARSSKRDRLVPVVCSGSLYRSWCLFACLRHICNFVYNTRWHSSLRYSTTKYLSSNFFVKSYLSSLSPQRH